MGGREGRTNLNDELGEDGLDPKEDKIEEDAGEKYWPDGRGQPWFLHGRCFDSGMDAVVVAGCGGVDSAVGGGVGGQEGLGQRGG